MTEKPILIAHGGAGSWGDEKQNAQNSIEEISTENYKKLKDGLNVEYVVESTVNSLENDSKFNAGYGSKLQLDGKPRPEGGIMSDDLSFGSVLGLEEIKNPVSVARLVKNECNNNMIGHPFSVHLALSYGFDKHNLVTEKELLKWFELKEELEGLSFKEKMDKVKEKDPGTGTVGCVAIDKNGNMCAATSTGGRRYQHAGRIGDSPIIGCGFFCNKDVAVSTTGIGEAIMKTQLARQVSFEYLSNDLQSAVIKSLNHLDKMTEGSAGVIAVSKKGEQYVDYNTQDMVYSKKY